MDIWKAAILFLAVYTGLVVAKHHRAHVTWAGIIVALAIGSIKLSELVPAVSWNVIGIFVGTLILAELFIISKVPERIADNLINRSPNLGLAIFSIIIFVSVLSMFVENVAAVLIVAPVALQLTRKAGVSPVPMMIGLAISSNLQGTATLIGDPPSMILAAAMKMNFMDFIIYKMRDGSGDLRPGIFWFVQAGAVVSYVVLYLFFKGMKSKPEKLPLTPVTDLVPTVLIILMILLLAFATFVDPGFLWFGGTVCVVLAILGSLWHARRDRSRFRRIMKGFDLNTTLFLMGIFIVVKMLENRGVIDLLVDRLAGVGAASPFVIYSVIVWGSVALSAFIDNVPYITAMLPVIIKLSADLGLPLELLTFGLLIGACIGGNITPIGASANVVAVGLLHREGKVISFLSFVKMGLPFTIAATGAAYLALWLFYR